MRTGTDSLLTDLRAVARKHILSGDWDVVISEPYVPFIPEKWNGLLVLAEAQNLSRKNADYVSELRSMSKADRLMRLQRAAEKDIVRIQPWDDGSLKLAVEAAFGVKASETAVSNAVLWSQVDESGNNVNPDEALRRRATEFWKELLAALQPRHIITAGNIARDVMQETGLPVPHTPLRLPSPSALSRVSSMFDEADLLERYPEVRKVAMKHPEWLDGGYRKNKVFFACHAVSSTADSTRSGLNR